MSRQLVVLWAGRHRRDDWDLLCDRYRSRISKSIQLRELPVKARGASDRSDRLQAEGRALLSAAPTGAWTIVLDQRGKMRSSEQLAEWLQARLDEWPGPLAFLLGSDLGLAGEVLEQARESISLGPMTLPHELARIVLYEQLYRAFCILAGIKYHREPL